MKLTGINLCYVIGNALLYMKKINRDDLEKIKNKLSSFGYSIDICDEHIYQILNEWRDFFMFNENNTEILLTEHTDKINMFLNLLFVKPLDDNVKSAIFNSIISRNKIENDKEKCKIILFKK